MFFERPQAGQQAVLVHLQFSRFEEAEQMAEFQELARAADLQPLALISGRRREPHPRSFCGEGKLTEIVDSVLATGANLVLFNHDLSAAQQRNLEAALQCRVIGRTELILHIFAARARTHEGQLQVELAQLRHAQSRLVRGWSHLDRQKGGVNLRGAGETQLEMDQRLLAERIALLERRLDKVRQQRAQGRRARQRAAVPTVALVGYTNAGKSTLFNALTDSTVIARDQLFATLDPTLRRLPLDGIGEVVLADTVGFIRDLPHNLVAAFKATLEEVTRADLLLHVIDAAAPDKEERTAQVQAVLAEIGAAERPVLEVHNKIDLMGQPVGVETDAAAVPQRVSVSAVSGAGLNALRLALSQRLGLCGPHWVRLSAQAGKTRSWLYGLGAVLDEQSSDNGDVELRVRLDARRLAQLQQQPGVLLQRQQALHRISPSH